MLKSMLIDQDFLAWHNHQPLKSKVWKLLVIVLDVEMEIP